jgi:penicillin-binding protein activator
MTTRTIFLPIFIVCALLIAGCSAPSRNVSRIQADETTDISGRWNDTDSRITAEAMIKDVLSRPWLSDFKMDREKKPVVIVGAVRNKSSEHIPVDLFIKDMEKELINSGEVTFVASSAQREEIRQERLDQQSNASLESAKQLANETGADFMLQGTIDTIEDSFEGKKAMYYQVNLELIDLEKNTKEWVGDKKIKKLIEQKNYKW